MLRSLVEFTALALLILQPSLVAQSTKSAPTPSGFSGSRALHHTKTLVGFGARVPGSSASAKAQTYIQQELSKLGWKVERQPFTAKTPRGPVSMMNLIACRNVTASSSLIIISGHYDTKIFPGAKFVGANDGGSSAGFLMELAAALPSGPTRSATCLVWFDGEEAYGNWSDTDSLYGSRYLANLWDRTGKLKRVRALINVDMIGDKNLGVKKEFESTAWLREMVWSTGQELGYRQVFQNEEVGVTDDHIPFLRLGVSAIDIIDFDFGPNNSWWHTDQDTVDKLSPHSFEVIGKTLVEVVRRLNSKP
jgi:glutaminyl-peptide cyclotransferase